MGAICFSCRFSITSTTFSIIYTHPSRNHWHHFLSLSEDLCPFLWKDCLLSWTSQLNWHAFRVVVCICFHWKLEWRGRAATGKVHGSWNIECDCSILPMDGFHVSTTPQGIGLVSFKERKYIPLCIFLLMFRATVFLFNLICLISIFSKFSLSSPPSIHFLVFKHSY